MKYKIFIAIIILNISCQKFLYDEDDKIGIIENENELEEAMLGIYGLLGNVFHNYDILAAFVLADDINIEADHVVPGYGECDFEIPVSSVENNISIIGSKIYQDFYKTIISANNLIKQKDQIQRFSQANSCIGEAYFIRSICYFYLTRLFGEIPIITDIEVKYDVYLSNIPDVYSFIEADMLEAMQLLPLSNQLARIPYSTPHKGTVKAILAEIYLNMAGYPLKDIEKYELAAKYAGEVIDSSEFYGMGLENDLAKVWDIDYFDNPEKIIGIVLDEIPVEPNEPGNWSSMEDYYEKVQRRIKPEYNFYINYPNNYRKKVSFYYGYNYGLITIDDEDYEYKRLAEPRDMGYCDFMYTINYRKWLVNGEYNIVAIYLYRYAHTLLTYAEAKARSGQLDASAYEAVNKIRRRANKIDINQSSGFDLQEGLNPEQFADSVIQERALEFCAEPEGRWFDILRLEKLEEIHNKRYDYEPEVPWYSNIPEENYYLDLPQEDIWLNPNLSDTLDQ